MLTTQIENRDGIQIVHLAGMLDSDAHASFESLLVPLVDPPRSRIVLDCAQLVFANSTNLALLGYCQHVAARNGSFLGIAGLNRRIFRIVDMLGMASLLKLYADVDAAVAAAAAS